MIAAPFVNAKVVYPPTGDYGYEQVSPIGLGRAIAKRGLGVLSEIWPNGEVAIKDGSGMVSVYRLVTGIDTDGDRVVRAGRYTFEWLRDQNHL